MAEQKTNIDYIYNDDALRALKKMESGSVNCIVTSPPYYALRTYMKDAVRLKENAPKWVVEELEIRGIRPIND